MNIIKSIKRLTRIVFGLPVDRKYISAASIKKQIAARAQQTIPADAPGYWNPTAAQLNAVKDGKGSTMEANVADILDQGQLGSCTANGWAGAFAAFAMKKLGSPVWLSRLYIYFYERQPAGNTQDDTGAEVVDGATVLTTEGAPLETDYTYSDDGSKFKQTPPASLDKKAAQHKVVNPLQVRPQQNHIMAALKAGFPVVMGFVVKSSFESAYTAKTGIVTMPKPSEEELGGHCTFWIGYTDSKGTAHFSSARDAASFKLSTAINVALRMIGIKVADITPPANSVIGVNSWGKGWGNQGKYYMPWAFVDKYCSDFYIFMDITN